jgi:hypothetical protein
MNKIAGMGVAAFVGGVSYFLSLGFSIPPGGDAFRFFATFGAIAGFSVGSVLEKRLGSFHLFRIFLVVTVALIVGYSAALTYILMTGMNTEAGWQLVTKLTALLTVTFFCLGFMLPLAGLSFTAGTESSLTQPKH